MEDPNLAVAEELGLDSNLGWQAVPPCGRCPVALDREGVEDLGVDHAVHPSLGMCRHGTVSEDVVTEGIAVDSQ